MKEYYVLKYRTTNKPQDQYVGLDSRSGGYPYPTTNPNSINFWNDKESANEYALMFKDENFIIELVKFEFIEL